MNKRAAVIADARFVLVRAKFLKGWVTDDSQHGCIEDITVRATAIH